jgi:hypothetical protein
MNIEDNNLRLLNKYGLPAATAYRVIQEMENSNQSEFDMFMIESIWIKNYCQLSPKGKHPQNSCFFQTFIGLVFNGHIKFSDKIKLREEKINGKNYQYVKTGIEVLENNFNCYWHPFINIPTLWKIILYKHGIKRKAYNYQLHILKVLIDHDMIYLIAK